MMCEVLMAKIACTYVGEQQVMLFPQGGPYFDKDGQVITNSVISKGQTLMLEDTEVLGYTILQDPRNIEDPIFLGVGRVILPQDEGKSAEELFAMGYQFHVGRADFEPYQQPSTTGWMTNSEGE